MKPIQRQPIWILFIVMGALGAGNGVVFPLIATIKDTYHLSAAGIGMMSGSTFLFALVSQLTLSKFADRGHARLLLITGLGLTVLALLLIATGSNTWQFVLSRSLEGLGYGMVGPASRAVIVAARPDDKGRYLGTLSSVELGGFVLAPFVGTVLAQHVSLGTPFFVLAVFVALALLTLIVQGLPEIPAFDRPPSPWTLLRMRPVVAMLVLGFALALPIGLYDPLWAVIFEDRGASVTFVSVTITAFGLPFLLLAPKAGQWAEKRGAFRTALQTQFLALPCLALYGILTKPGWMASVGILDGAVQAAAIPAAYSAMVLISPPDRIAAAQGLYGSAGLLASGGMAFISPSLYHWWGPTKLFVGASVVGAILVIGVAIMARGSEVRSTT